MSQNNLPDEDHIVRYVPWKHVAKDADDNVSGIMGEAFRRRPEEDGLSVNWLERADAPAASKLKKTVELLTSGLRIGPKARIAIANVADLKRVCSSRNAKIRIVHIPVEGNEPHSEMRQFPRDNDELLELIAAEAISVHYRCQEILAQ